MNVSRPLRLALPLILLTSFTANAQEETAPPLAMRLQRVKTLGDARLRHGYDVTHIEPLSDGRRALTSSRDGAVRLWDLETGEELQRYLPAKGDDVWNVKLLPGDREFLSCGDDNHATRWNLETGEVVAQYKLSSTGMRLAVVPGGKQFIACDSGRSASLWNVVEGDRVRVFKGHKESVYSAAVSPDGKICVTCGEDGTVRGWDVATGDKKWVIEKLVPDEEGIELPLEEDIDPFGAVEPPVEEAREDGPGHAEDVFTVCFLPNGKHVVSCSEDTAVSLWNAEDGKLVWSKSVSDSAKVVACSPDGSMLAITSDDSTIHLLSATNGKSQRVIKAPGGTHWGIAFSSDGKRVLSGGDHMIYQWDAATGKQIFPPPKNDHVRGAIDAIAVSADGTQLFASAEDERVHAWDLKTGEKLGISCPSMDDVHALHISPDGGRIVLVSDEQILIRDLKSGKQLRKIPVESPRAAVFADGGKLVITSDWEGNLFAWDLETGNQSWGSRTDERNSSGRIEHLAVSRDGRQLVAAGDNFVQMHKVADGSVLRRVAGNLHLSVETAVLLNDDRGLLLMGEVDDNPRLVPLLPTVARNPKPLPPKEIARLISNLGSEEFSARERAMQTLIAGGEQILTQLDADSDDSEVRWRLEKIRDRVREGLLPTTVLEHVELKRTPQDATPHPTQPLWAMVAGYDCRSTLQLGGVKGQGIALGEIVCDGHSPSCVAFGPDGTHLFTGNRDGTVSVYAIAPAP